MTGPRKTTDWRYSVVVRVPEQMDPDTVRRAMLHGIEALDLDDRGVALIVRESLERLDPEEAKP